MTYLTEEFAQVCYKNLLTYHQMENKLATKVPALKNQLENEILEKVTGINHYRGRGKRNDPDYQKGQKDWLFDRRIKRDRHGNISEGDVEPGIVSGIDNLINLRNEAEHEKEMSYADYMGIFGLMVKVIHSFSNCPIPKEIDDILNNVVAAPEPSNTETAEAKTGASIHNETLTDLIIVESEENTKPSRLEVSGNNCETEGLQLQPLINAVSRFAGQQLNPILSKATNTINKVSFSEHHKCKTCYYYKNGFVGYCKNRGSCSFGDSKVCMLYKP